MPNNYVGCVKVEKNIWSGGLKLQYLMMRNARCYWLSPYFGYLLKAGAFFLKNK
jgi:hypothetical protein